MQFTRWHTKKIHCYLIVIFVQIFCTNHLMSYQKLLEWKRCTLLTRVLLVKHFGIRPWKSGHSRKHVAGEISEIFADWKTIFRGISPDKIFEISSDNNQCVLGVYLIEIGYDIALIFINIDFVLFRLK